MRRTFLLFFLGIISFVKSQGFKPSDSVIAAFKTPLIAKYEAEKNKFLEEAGKVKGSKQRKLYKDIYTSIYDNLLHRIHRNEIYYYPKFEEYITDIVKEFAQYNPEIHPEKLKVLISRDMEPNAYTIINGTITFNQYFLNSLENENELAAVLAHEIGHHLLKHPETKIENTVNSYTNDSIVAASKNIKSQQFNRNAEAEKLLRKIIYGGTKNTREREIQADAKAFEILKNTKYATGEIISLLKIMDVADKEKDSLTEKDFHDFFTLPNETFDEKLLKGEDASEYLAIDENYFKWNIDSLKTHPSCAERIKLVEKLHGNQNGVYAKNSKLFTELKDNSELENIYNQYFTENYGISLYESLKYLKKKPDNIFAEKMVLKNLRKLKTARENRTYGKYILPPNPKEQSKSLQTFFIFFDNLTNTNFNKILDLYEKKYANLPK